MALPIKILTVRQHIETQFNKLVFKPMQGIEEGKVNTIMIGRDWMI